MASLSSSQASNQDEESHSLYSDGSTGSPSSSTDNQSQPSELICDVPDHEFIILAESTQPGFFPERGHMVYIPCMLCTLLYHKGQCTSLSKNLLKHRNHIYVHHWILFRCNQCGDSLDNSYSIPCPLQSLKKIAQEHIKHDKTCKGGSSCYNLTLHPEKFSCCHNIAFGKTTFKEPKLPLDMKERLTILPQVEFPAKRHVKHDCTTELCVDQNLLKEVLQTVDCKLIGELTHGDFSNTYKASNKPSNEALCIKAACLHNYANNAICHSVDTEIYISQLTHETNTPVLFHYGVFRLRDTIFMVSQQTKNGNLTEYLVRIGGFGEETYRKMITTLCRGIQFLHSHCIAHRNLKIDNILVGESPTDLKIAGLGSSCIVQPDRLINYPFVSYQYAAPEFFQTRCFDPLKPDIWSLGVIMFFLFNRKHLFPNSSISQPRKTPLLNWNYSLQSKSFLEALLAREYKSRPNIKMILEHQWLHQR